MTLVVPYFLSEGSMAEYICPHCGISTYDDEALLCPFCGESLQRPTNGFLGRIRYANQGVVWFFIAFFVLCAFVLLFLR